MCLKGRFDLFTLFLVDAPMHQHHVFSAESMSGQDLPVLFKREASDQDGLIQMGMAMLEAFYESIDLHGCQIVDVELPLSATLYTDAGEATDFKLVGVIDLLLLDESQELLVVDHKTAARAKSQSAVDDDLQFASYA